MAVYSDLHKEFVESKIKEVITRCNQMLEIKFFKMLLRRSQLIEKKKKQLTEEKILYKAELSKLFQKMTEYLELKDNKIKNF